MTQTFKGGMGRAVGWYVCLASLGCVIALPVYALQGASATTLIIASVLFDPFPLFLAWFGYRLATTSLMINDDHVVVRNAFHTRRLVWAEIAGFELGASFSSGRCLRIRTRDGESIVSSAVVVSPATASQQKQVLATIAELEAMRASRADHFRG